MSTDKQIISGHYIFHWGVPTSIRPAKARGIDEFAIFEFGPTESRTTWRYATNGMSSYVQPCPDENVIVRTELYSSAKEKKTWIDDLLVALASYPQDYATFFAEGDSIDVGQPIDQNASCFTGILLGPPNPPSIGLVAGLRENVLVHRVIGILPDEIEFAKEHSGKMLWQKLAQHGELLLDEKRPSVL
jgi:hypothetical protein